MYNNNNNNNNNNINNDNNNNNNNNKHQMLVGHYTLLYAVHKSKQVTLSHLVVDY